MPKNIGLSLSSHDGARAVKPALKRNSSSPDVNQLANTLKACKLCTKKPLRLTSKDLPALAALGDNALFELIHSIRNQKLYDDGEPSVELAQADDIVARARDKAKQFEQERTKNLTKQAPLDLNLYQENLNAMGKLEWGELKIGALLGVGGFSNVSELCGFTLTETTPKYTNKEQVARKFLSMHAKRTTDNVTEDSLRSTKGILGSSNKFLSGSSHHSSTGATTKVSYRYALKHLKPKLSEIYSKRTFRCAAVDLIQEVQFLLSLQHPNIIKIRGFAAAGPEGYRQGNHNGYFLILDLLPETMEKRLVAWRKGVKKCKSMKRYNLVSKVLLKKNHTNRDTASRKLDELLDERYRVAAEIAGAMEYLHERRIIHRDLKIANIGFDVRGDVKLFDFGLSRWLPTSLLIGATQRALLEENFHMSSVGTKLYMAPEVMAKQPYSAKADVYSYGIVLWEMLCLSDPHDWTKKKDKDAMPLCPCWPLPLQQTLQRCVSPQANERPSFTEIRQMFHDDTEEFAEEPNIKDASDDDVPRSTNQRRCSASNDEDDDEEGNEEEQRDSIGELQQSLGTLGADSGHQAGRPPRRRSTFILDFNHLSWLSSGSLRNFMDNSSSRTSLPTTTTDINNSSSVTARTSTSTVPELAKG